MKITDVMKGTENEHEEWEIRKEDNTDKDGNEFMRLDKTKTIEKYEWMKKKLERTKK
jgi:hypothetical protein